MINPTRTLVKKNIDNLFNTGRRMINCGMPLNASRPNSKSKANIVVPAECPFDKRHCYTKDVLSKPDELRVMTYNILAEIYTHSEYSRKVLFAHCPSHALKIKYRRQLILREILGYNADLICLQEVDKREFLNSLEPLLEANGKLSGVYSLKGGRITEGLATFYRRDKFEFVDSHRTLMSEIVEPLAQKIDSHPLENGDDNEHNVKPTNPDDEKPHPILADRDSPQAEECLYRFNLLRSAIQANEGLKKRFIDRNTILQTTLLKFKDLPDRHLLVANTHLYFAPDADHIRLLQGSVIIKYLEFLKDHYERMLQTKVISLFCGDLNSTPDCGLNKLFTEGKATRDLVDWSSNKEEAVIGLEVETNLRFSSAYQDIEYTNYVPGFHGCLDYIFYEQDNLVCESTVPPPDHDDVIATGGMPSEVFPSDHIALIANLKFLS